MLVGRHVAQFWQRLQLLHERRRPGVQLIGVGVFECVLILSAAHAVFDGQILDGLHVKGDAIDFRQLGLQSEHDFGCADFALFQWLEVNKDAAAVECGVDAVHANKGGEALNGWVFENDLCQGLLLFGHGSEGNVLRGF